MFLFNLATAILAVASPAASPAPHEPKTIITVVSSPYCKSLAQHFNNALVPMLANDRTLDGVSVQLDDMNNMFEGPNYVQQFLHIRDTLGHQETVLNNSLSAIQQEINALRDGSTLTTDKQAAADIHEAAQNLQTAYDHQRQLAIDTQNLYITLLRYNPNRLHPTLGGFDPQDMAAPADARDIKSYLRFNGQRDVIATNEDKATDVALNAAQTFCVQQK
ncbi:MAG: hypothetical protein WBP75_03075 [Candidatus Cybelea sp.]